MTILVIADELFEKLERHPAVVERLREITRSESFQINGKEIDPARVEIKRVNGVVRITVDDSADFYTRQQDAEHLKQLQRVKKRPAWKTPYGPQR